MVERVSRNIAHYGLAGLVMMFFVTGLATITLLRRANASFDAWRPRAENTLRTIHPGRVELRGIVKALMTFAEAVAEEMLRAFWKPRPE